MNEENSNKSGKQPRTRSPAYPAIDLEDAIFKARTIWEKANRHAVSMEGIGTYWGYDSKSSAGISAASAMKKYGLFVEEGSKDKRTVKLSELGIKLIYNPDLDSPDYKAALAEAALNPSIHLELWDKYGGHLPDDAGIKRYLVVDRKFNDSYVDSVISTFRKSIAFAKLYESGITNEAIDTVIDTQRTVPATSQTKRHVVTRALQAQSEQTAPNRPAFSSSSSAYELSLPLENGKTIRIPRMTEGDYDLMLETLRLWKRRIVQRQTDPQDSE